MIERFKGVSS